MNNLPPKPRANLTKILGLLGSDIAGERDAAVCAASRLLTRHGLRWPDLLELRPLYHREPLMSRWRLTCAKLATQSDRLRPWERRFVGDLPNFHRISTKQRYVLFEIAARVLGEDAAS